MTAYLVFELLFWGLLSGLSAHLLRGTVEDKTGVAVYMVVCAVQFALAWTMFLAPK